MILSRSFSHLALLGSFAGSLGAEEPSAKDPDLLRFSNGDALHGQFLGMDNPGSLNWTGSSIKTPITLQTNSLRRLALNGGRAIKALPHPEFIQLANGDQVPGRVVELNEEHLTIDTPIGDTLTVERKFVTSISPNPFGGTLHFMGPFTKDNWSLIEVPEGEPSTRARATKKPPEEKVEDDPWVFGGDAWYSNGQMPLSVDAKIPDKARISFRLAWRSRLSAVIAFHATLETPEIEVKEGEEEDKKRARPASSSSSSFPYTYGHSYVLTVYSSYAMLYRCDFAEDGTPKLTRLANSSATIHLDETGEAKFELRCDRENSNIMLFVNDEYVNQWDDAEGYAGTGTNLAFACQNAGSRLRVSDVVVSSWNGMADSARSMDSEDRDTILLNNGTDRFSGHIVGIKDGHYHLKGAYAEMQIPTGDVEEIRFAKASQAELPDPSNKALRLILRPIGRISLEPTTATATQMTGRHPALGDLKLDLGFASLLEFSFSNSILDTWDDDF